MNATNPSVTVLPNCSVVNPKPADPLSTIFMPRSIAVIGASGKEGSVGYTVLRNLLYDKFEGTVFPVNPKHATILGLKTYPDITKVPEHIDLAVIITPAETVPSIIAQCVQCGVGGAVIISAGFKEIGEKGAILEGQIMAAASGKMRIIGPNCFGVMNPRLRLNATFASGIAGFGSVGFITQSGALGSAIIDWSIRENVGYSLFASVGSMVDVDWGDLITYLGDDPNTHSIVIYMESIGNALSFLSAAKKVAAKKPIIVIKPGRTEAASKAAASHTGSLTGSDEVLDTAFRQCGVIRVNAISELFSLSELFAKQPLPKGSRLTILTNAGGPGVLATDALILGGGMLAELPADQVKKLDDLLPPAWSHANPIDILGDATPERYGKALEIIAGDPNSDALLVILAPQAMTSPTDIARELVPYALLANKPILACWIGGDAVTPGIRILNSANIPTFEYPDMAVRMFNYMWRYTHDLHELSHLTNLTSSSRSCGRMLHFSAQKATDFLSDIKATGRTLLTEFEAKQVLSFYDIPTVSTLFAATEDDAARHAESLGYPVVMKLHSERITHKTDVGGVELNIPNQIEVRKAFHAMKHAVAQISKDDHAFMGVTIQPMIKRNGYECIIGSSTDAQFGPVILFGMGGQLVEVFNDHACALPPLTSMQARSLIERTLVSKALKGVRGRKPVDMDALEQFIVSFSLLVSGQPLIKEIEINPLIVSSEDILALDARIILHS